MSLDLQEMWDQLLTTCAEIDEKLDSRSDSKSATKRSIINGYITENEASWKSVVDQFVGQLGELPVEKLAGIYYGIVRGLDSAFSAKVSAHLDSTVESAPKIEPLISEEEVAPLTKIRSDIFSKLKSIKELASTFDQGEDWELPKRRTGAKGKRGKRALSFFTWSVEGDDKEYTKLAEIVELYPAYDKVGDLTKAMREAGLNLTKPEGNLEFTLPDGKTLTGFNGISADDTPEDDDDDENGDED